MSARKVCGHCKSDLPVEQFYFRSDRNCLTSKCRGCFGAVQRSYKARPEIKAKQRASRAEWQKKASIKSRGAISEIYAKKLLTANTLLKSADLPAELVKLKQVQIAISRLIKDEK